MEFGGAGVLRLAVQALRSSGLANLSALIVMGPMMVVAINRAVRSPVVMIPGVDAESSVHTAYSTANGTSDDGTNRTGGPASMRGAPLHSSDNALSMARGRDRKEKRDNGIF